MWLNSSVNQYLTDKTNEASMKPQALAAVFLFFCLMPAASALGQTNYGDRTQQRELIDGKSAYIKGLEAFENADYEKALDLLSTAYVKLPKNAGVNYALADAYQQIGDLPNATYYGKQAVELEPDNKWFRLKLAEIYRKAGRNQATLEELEETLNYHPHAGDVLAELAETYASYGEFLESNKAYNRLLQLTGESINIRLQKLKNFNRLGIRDSAITELQKIRELDPDNLATMQTLSNYYLEMNNSGEAKSMLNKALQRNPRDPKTLIMLADIYANESKWDSVGTMLTSVVTDPIINPEAKLTVAQYLVSQNKQHPDNEALQQATSGLIEKFTAQEPQFARAHALAADYFSQTNQNEQALKAITRTTELMPSNDEAWRQRLQLLLGQGRYEEAIAIGPEAEKNVPQDPFILYFWGSAYLAEQQHKPAVEKLEAASGLPARRQLKSAILTSLGDAHSSLDNWDRAFEAYEQALSLNPDNDLVLNNYAYFLSLQQKELDKAEEMAQRANRISPGNVSYLDTIGWIYYQKEEYDKAQEYIRKSIDTGEASAEVMEHYGDVLDKLNRPEEAREWWEKAYREDSTRTQLKEKISN